MNISKSCMSRDIWIRWYPGLCDAIWNKLTYSFMECKCYVSVKCKCISQYIYNLTFDTVIPIYTCTVNPILLSLTQIRNSNEIDWNRVSPKIRLWHDSFLNFLQCIEGKRQCFRASPGAIISINSVQYQLMGFSHLVM